MAMVERRRSLSLPMENCWLRPAARLPAADWRFGASLTERYVADLRQSRKD
jgi:hypothetical protein